MAFTSVTLKERETVRLSVARGSFDLHQEKDRVAMEFINIDLPLSFTATRPRSTHPPGNNIPVFFVWGAVQSPSFAHVVKFVSQAEFGYSANLLVNFEVSSSSFSG